MSSTLLTLIGGPANLTQMVVQDRPSGSYFVPVFAAVPASNLRSADSYNLQKAEYEVHRVTDNHFVGVYRKII